jgi:hypothetical protein
MNRRHWGSSSATRERFHTIALLAFLLATFGPRVRFGTAPAVPRLPPLLPPFVVASLHPPMLVAPDSRSRTRVSDNSLAQQYSYNKGIYLSYTRNILSPP